MRDSDDLHYGSVSGTPEISVEPPGNVAGPPEDPINMSTLTAHLYSEVVPCWHRIELRGSLVVAYVFLGFFEHKVVFALIILCMSRCLLVTSAARFLMIKCPDWHLAKKCLQSFGLGLWCIVCVHCLVFLHEPFKG